MAAAFGGRVLIAVIVVLGLLHNAAAETYYVGQTSSNGGGWTLNTSEPYGPSYDSQFTNTNFVVGDVLTFDFQTGVHNVYVVTASEASTCDQSSPLEIYDNALNYTLNTTGSHGFICAVENHCSTYGMKLTVTVSGSGSPSPSPSEGSKSPSPAPSGGLKSPSPAPSGGLKSPSPAPSGGLKSPSPAPSGGLKSPAPAPGAPSPPAPVTPTTGAPPPTSPASTGSPVPPSPGAASLLKTGPAMAMGALLAACAVLAL